ncbi:MAG TPA: bifunctional [glutamate--ammonia ligase]-adenylyl-L-tyrosine phosphorylase/[glutamate--ammonia-ligase] adenylyltransferase, partial [Burkholderiales bacterium]|nr:bifunctional [glutamate--ammonia ligase]-adenylyl-L-tyrosine phosphorylase/[glutamate--ammonia-ligase] adenylyltransferase [Burkholderiales bacterium]
MPDPIQKITLSRVASRLLAARPELAAELDAANPFPIQEIERALAGAGGDDESAFKRRLRRLRQRVLLHVMARDFAGGADPASAADSAGRLAEVCGTMSDLAEASIRSALAWANRQFSAAHGTPRTSSGAPCDLIVVGMGKLGGRELNVSSDIDLVFLYPEEGETDGARPLTNHEYFDRVGRKTISLLADRTEDGFVFRVDMRLRPYGASGPLVASFEALESYLVSQGREWERYAWIKARPVTGDDAPGTGDNRHAELDAIVRPFVYRKYLDFGTLAAMRRLHAEVRREVERRELAEHIKLGPGGIREIEFVAQALQLVRGGREPALAVRPTLEVLARLAERRMLPEAAARELAESYVFLRQVEHRLQYLDDAQTHTLPDAADDRARVAAMAGFESWESFYARLGEFRAQVTRHFQNVFAESQGNGLEDVWQDDRDAAATVLAGRGFRDAQATAARLAATRSSQRYAALSEDSKRRVDQLVPTLAAAAAEMPDPDATLARGLDLVEAIARRAAYLALLA